MAAVNDSTHSIPALSALRLVGRDVLSVLHRVTSNDLASLAEGASRATLFCDFRGRLLHRALVVRTADGAWLVTDSPGETLAAFVDAKVFREDVKLAEGPVAVPASLDRLARDAFGADETARIAAGLPRFAHEIADDFNPYEANLGGEVHLNKGCYTGQEALQRLVTYDSVRRRLARVSGVGETPAPQDVLAAADVVGRLTSAIASADGWRGLAIVRGATLDEGATLRLADGTAIRSVEPFAPAAPLGRG